MVAKAQGHRQVRHNSVWYDRQREGERLVWCYCRSRRQKGYDFKVYMFLFPGRHVVYSDGYIVNSNINNGPRRLRPKIPHAYAYHCCLMLTYL